MAPMCHSQNGHSQNGRYSHSYGQIETVPFLTSLLVVHVHCIRLLTHMVMIHNLKSQVLGKTREF